MSPRIVTRVAVEADLGAIDALMTLAIDRLQTPFLSPEQVAASHSVMGLDTQLVRDGTYLVAEEDGVAIGCGGWSWRATLYGGDHGTAPRDAAVLDPRHDAARVRAMYTHPDHARRGIGRMILDRCEDAASAHGFRAVELMATASGEPLYRACGYLPVERRDAVVGGIAVPLLLMRKAVSTPA